MPNRLLSIAILVSWALMTVSLLRRDVLPGLLVGPPPDFRSVANVDGRTPGPTRWSILVADDEDAHLTRSVGQVTTEAKRTTDGWVRLSSVATFDSAELFRNTPFGASEKDRVEIQGHFAVEPSGNLDALMISVRLESLEQNILVLNGHVRHNDLELVARSPLVPLFNWQSKLPYRPRSLVQSALGPLESLPGLQVGQRWTSRVVNPISGRVDDVSMSVERRANIFWNGEPVSTFEVVTRMGPVRARSWVRTDGLVIKQEAPLPFVRLILEREPEDPSPRDNTTRSPGDARP